jgi:RHS repeat-associated protein
MTQTSTGDVWTYTYNYRNQMTGATEKTSGGTVLSQTTYTYDGLGNRIGIDENATQTWTLFDGSSPVMDFNSSGSLTMRYLNGPIGDLVDTVLSRQSSGGTVAWYLPDRLGTIRDLISTSGSIIDHVDFGAFGNQLDESSPSNGDRVMGFAGTIKDIATDLNLSVARALLPTIGRWTSQDQIGFAAGDTNLNRYTGNDPIDSLDPLGTDAKGANKQADEDPWARRVGLPPAGDIPKAKDSDTGSTVQQIWQQDWDQTLRDGKEHGGWIYLNPNTGLYKVVRAPVSRRRADRRINLSNPPIIKCFKIVSTWHTHPGPPGVAEPSGPDKANNRRRGTIGWIIGGDEDGSIIPTPY